MAKTLTRSQLFDLIWFRPRSKLAAECGISDVTLGKHCAQANVPGAQPGYWARKEAGKAGYRPPLPLRLSGHPREITMSRANQHYHWPPEEDLSELLHPPEFSEKLEEQVAVALEKIGRIAVSRDLSNPHRALKHVMDSETRRRQKYVRDNWSFYEPHFDDAPYQRQFRIFEVATELQIIEPTDKRTPKKTKSFKTVNAKTLRTGSEASPLGILERSDQPDNKIECRLGCIVEALLSSAGRSLRARAQKSFERGVERRIEIENE